MIVRGLDSANDWQFGKGLNDYKSNLDAVAQNIQTRLNSVIGNCFFDAGAGLDWFNLNGGKSKTAIELAVAGCMLNTNNVTGILHLSSTINAARNITITYKVQTTYSTISGTYQYDTNAVV